MTYDIDTIKCWSEAGNTTSAEVTLELIAQIEQLKTCLLQMQNAAIDLTRKLEGEKKNSQYLYTRLEEEKDALTKLRGTDET